jgi:hypothetical protein
MDLANADHDKRTAMIDERQREKRGERPGAGKPGNRRRRRPRRKAPPEQQD